MPVCGDHHASNATSCAASVAARAARAMALRLTTRVTFHQRVPEGGGRRWSDVYSRPQSSRARCEHTPTPPLLIRRHSACRKRIY